ncbi:MAG: archease [Acetomicrobium sp.]|jgi:SHS2 domain-containing protein|uniref:archease n=1 Tax=Acetomicrobium sp. TaxID=1872099 RepID=UPI002B263231|nr:archease [Acetomicrobium sp.]
MPWVELPHTADAGLEIRASDAGSLITESAKALYSFIFGDFLKTSKAQSGEEYVVELDCIDLLELFVSWLNELLFIYEVKGKIFLPENVEIDLQGVKLIARGTLQDAPRPIRGVKAVTYGGAEIKSEPIWKFRVYLDL